MTEFGGLPPEAQAAAPAHGAGVRPRGAGSNAAWLTIEKIAHLGVAFVVTFVVAAALGATDFGRIAIGLALLALLLPVTHVIAQCLIRDEVAHPEQANGLYTAGVVVASLVSALAVLLTVLVTALTVGLDNATGVVIVVMVGSVLLRPLMVVDGWFLVRMNSKQAVIIRLIALLSTGALRCLLPLFGFGVVAVAWTFVAEAALGAVGMWVVFRRMEKNFRWHYDKGLIKSLAKEMAPLLVTTSSVLIFSRINQIMLAPLSTLAEAGVFAVAVSLAITPRFPLVALMVSSAPRLLRLRKVSEERFQEELLDLSRLVTLLGWGLALGLILIVAPIAPLLLGDDFDGLPWVIVVLAISTPISCIGNILVGVTNWEKLYREAVTRNVTATVLSVGLNFVFLPLYGALGAAIVTVIATLWVYVIGAALAAKTRPVLLSLLPTLEPISSARILWAHRKRRKAEDALIEEMNAFYENEPR